MYDILDSVLAQKIAQVDGVGQTFTGGSAKPAVRVEANPNQLASYGVGLEALRTAVSSANVLQPTGYINGDQERVALYTTDQLFGSRRICSADCGHESRRCFECRCIEWPAGVTGFGGFRRNHNDQYRFDRQRLQLVRKHIGGFDSEPDYRRHTQQRDCAGGE